MVCLPVLCRVPIFRNLAQFPARHQKLSIVPWGRPCPSCGRPCGILDLHQSGFFWTCRLTEWLTHWRSAGQPGALRRRTTSQQHCTGQKNASVSISILCEFCKVLLKSRMVISCDAIKMMLRTLRVRSSTDTTSRLVRGIVFLEPQVPFFSFCVVWSEICTIADPKSWMRSCCLCCS